MRTPWWWRDATVLTQIQTAGTVIATALAVFAILYAWRVATRQFEVMDEQTAISKRQTAIAETQDKLMKDQLDRKARLYVSLTPEPNEDGSVSIVVMVLNRGNKTAPDFYWWVYLPKEQAPGFSVVPVSELIPQRYKTAVGPLRIAFGYFYPKPVYPGGMAVHIATLKVASFSTLKPFDFDWKLVSEDGPFPPGTSSETIRVPPRH